MGRSQEFPPLMAGVDASGNNGRCRGRRAGRCERRGELAGRAFRGRGGCCDRGYAGAVRGACRGAGARDARGSGRCRRWRRVREPGARRGAACALPYLPRRACGCLETPAACFKARGAWFRPGRLPRSSVSCASLRYKRAGDRLEATAGPDNNRGFGPLMSPSAPNHFRSRAWRFFGGVERRPRSSAGEDGAR